MTAVALISLAIKASLALTVIGIGLHARPGAVTHLVRDPGLLARSVLAMNVIMPVLALWVAMVFALNPAVKLALVALAMSPVPPFLPKKIVKTSGEGSYAISLLAMESALAVVFIPLTAWVLGNVLGTSVDVPMARIARIVVTGLLMPLALGIGIRRFWPTIADRIAKPISMVAMSMLIVGLVPILVKMWHPMVSMIGNGTVAAIVALTLVALALGHALGGPAFEDRPVLALSTASRHPAIAITIASAASASDVSIAPVVLLDLIVVAIVSAPYVRWVQRQARRRAGATPSSEEPRSFTDGTEDEGALSGFTPERRAHRR